LDEEAKTAWSNVESSYQRRADLIPNLVSTVRGYADFEQETLENVIKARASATSTTIDPTNLTAENMAAFQTAQNSLSGALSRLLVTIERYPDLKANQNFLELQSQLEGTENRINVERNRYNTAVKTYNQQIRKFPYTLFAGMFGFEQMTPYEAAEGSDVAPEVVF
jgi:LemA protein